MDLWLTDGFWMSELSRGKPRKFLGSHENKLLARIFLFLFFNVLLIHSLLSKSIHSGFCVFSSFSEDYTLEYISQSEKEELKDGNNQSSNELYLILWKVISWWSIKHIKCGAGFLFLCNLWLKTIDSVEILNSSAPAVCQQIHHFKINAEQCDESFHKLFFLFKLVSARYRRDL